MKILHLQHPEGVFDAIDPGTTYYGRARMQGRQLIACEYVPNLFVDIMSRALPLVIEGQRFRPGSRAEPQTIIDLAFSAGVIRGQYHGEVVKLDDPQMWKGTIDAGIMLRRIVKRLVPQERAVLGAALDGVKAKDHEHVIDAIGIALHMVGRLAQ